MASTRGSKATQALVESPDIDAVYVALPNALHAEPTIRALKAGKAVLCEKPLSVGAAQTKEVLDVAATAAAPLWEAFVFPFQAQHQRLKRLLEDGAIGEPAELYSAFHFLLSNPANIRMDAALGGGALADVGCYPIRLAFELFGAPQRRSRSAARRRAGEMPRRGVRSANRERGRHRRGRHRHLRTGSLTRRLLLTLRLQAQLRHLHQRARQRRPDPPDQPVPPGPADTLTITRPNADPVTERPTTDQRSFTAAIRHIHAVLRGEEAPRSTPPPTTRCPPPACWKSCSDSS